MRPAATVAPVRTAVGAFGGALHSVGVEHLSAERFGFISGMIETAENLAREFSISPFSSAA
jgi:hypothetical protein